ncbi:ATP-binding protein [Halobacteriales archaeon QS_4_69_34]|nr:MAG: ATP-binding protein [Halobacteriales archaeon QS_4_69_34]
MSENPLDDDPFAEPADGTGDDPTAEADDPNGGADGDATPAESDGTDEEGAAADADAAVGDADATDGGPAGGLAETSVPSSATELDDGEVGHVLASEGIHVSRGEYTVNAFVATGRRDAVRVGDYVRVPYPGSGDALFAVVDGLRYEPYTDLDDRSDAHNLISRERPLNEGEFVLVAELEPITILSAEDDANATSGRTAGNSGAAGSSRTAKPGGAGGIDDADALSRGIVNQVPKPNTRVALATREAVLREGLNLPGEGVFCGYLAVGGDRMTVRGGEPFPYYLANPGIDPDTGETESGEPAVFRHTLVAGSTGKGKTHFTKNLLRQFVGGKRYPVESHATGDTERSRLNVVVLDPENEYWQMRDDGDLPDAATRRLERAGVEVGGVEDLEVFVPSVANTTDPATGASKSFSIPFSLVESRPELLMPYTPTEVTRGALEGCLSSYFGRRGSDGPPTYEGFRAYLDANAEEDSPLRTRHEIADGTWSAIMRRVKGGVFGDVFDGGNASAGSGGSAGASGTNPLPEVSGRMFREGQVTVIPTGHLRGGKEELVVLSILSYVIENNVSDHDVDPHLKDTPMLVAVDEAHNYLAGAETLRGEYIVGRAREAAKQGRKDQLGLMLITQNPEDVDADVLKQTNTNVFLGLREEVVEKVPSVPTEFKRDIPRFGKGQAVVKAPDVEAVEVVGLPYCLTRHDN